MAIGRGTRFGPYEITALLGAGAMGEVYRARDHTLGRDVAIKVLPEAFTSDRDRLARFEREARALAALNNPHVGAIYGVEDAGGVRALVLELVDGDTLADRIGRGPLPVRDALRFASQIAEALDAAHKRGIIHRDLKPANIKITTEGAVKVLDFGLAKTWDIQTPDLTHAPTVTVAGTREGVVLGTAGYMSPEQARGQSVDVRTDVWALGCVLYEMLTGQRAFGGQTVSDTIAKILEREPDWTALPGGTPPTVRGLLRRCLGKDPYDRPPSIAVVREVLDLARTPVARPVMPRAVAIGGAALVTVALAIAAALWFRADRPLPMDSSRWEQLTNFADAATQPALSPDGRMLTFIRGDSTFVTAGDVYLKLLPDGDATPIVRDDLTKMDPVFSPDGTRIAYTVVGGNMAGADNWSTWVVPVVRGEARLWLRNASGLRWVDSNQLLFSEIKRGGHMGIVTATENRSASRELYFPAHESAMAHRSVRSPDGRSTLVVEMDERGVFTPCRLIPADGSSSGRLVGPAPSRCTNAAWAPTGQWMYFTADIGTGFHIWRQRFPDGEPEQITAGTTQEEGLAIAADGRSIITSVGQQRRGIWIHDASGERQISLEGYAFWPIFSADGQTLCFRVTRGIGSGQGPSELWMMDLRSGRAERLLPGQVVSQYDLSSDDRVVAAVVEADGATRLWMAWLDGRVPPRRLTDFEASNPRFGAAGDIFFLATEGRTTHLFRTNAEGVLRETVSPDIGGSVIGTASPDGRWLTGVKGSDMFAFSTTGAADVPIFRSSVSRLRWSPDGTRVLLNVQTGQASAFGFGRTYVLPLEAGSMLPRTPPGGFQTEAEIAAVPGVEILPYGDLSFRPTPGVHAYSKITVARNLYRIPLP